MPSRLHPFGKLLRELRSHREILLGDMARAMNLNAAQLCDVEKGYRRATIHEVMTAADMLHLDNAGALTLLRASEEPLRNKAADDAEDEKARAEGLVFVSYAHQEGNPACLCNSCRFERDAG